MEDTFGKVVAIFLCAVQMFIIPIYLYGENMQRVEYSYITSEITYYIDNIRNTGIIDENGYNNLGQKIYSLQKGYTLTWVHSTHSENEAENKTEYFDSMYYKDDIENALESTGEYHMQKNDYVNVNVSDKSGNVIIRYGGSVKNEAY